MKGFEVSFQTPFSFLPAPFDKFGVQLNYTHVISDIDYCQTTTCATFVTDDLVNLSPNAYNATLYYENSLFSARVSASFRDRYLQLVPGRNTNAVEGKAETLSIDASGSYNVNENVQLTFEAINLTDEANQQFVGSGARESTSVYHKTGRQFMVGARFRFR